MKWRKNMPATASEKIWRELCFHRVKMASRAAKKKTVLLRFLMNEKLITINIRVLVTPQSSTVCSVVFCSIGSLLCSGIAIFKHERAELWELKMLISDWFIFNWSQGPVPRPCSHEGPSKILRGPVPATGPMNSNQFEFLGPISGTKIQPLRPDGFLTKIGLFTRWDLVAGTGPCDRSLRPVPSCVATFKVTIMM